MKGGFGRMTEPGERNEGETQGQSREKETKAETKGRGGRRERKEGIRA